MSDNLLGQLNKLLAVAGPAELGPGPRPGVWTQVKLDAELNPILREARVGESSRELIRAVLLLWHDHLDASHTISQSIENADGSFLHAIMHRREPDYWNSKYWWRRVGTHPCFPEIARRVTELLKSKGERELLAKLVPHGDWDPGAFVDACQAVAGMLPSDEQVELLQAIQRIESEAALQYLVES